MPAPVEPFKVPTAIRILDAQMSDGTKSIVFQIASPTGVAVYFVEPETARAAAEQILAMTPGIVMPTLAQTLASAIAKREKV